MGMWNLSLGGVTVSRKVLSMKETECRELERPGVEVLFSGVFDEPVEMCHL